MGRPRSLKVKLVLDLPEEVYQRVAVRAFQLNESVVDYSRRTLDVASAVVVPLPLLDPVGAVPPVPPPAVPVVSHEEPKAKGKK